MVNTGKITDRRALKFSSVDDALAEADRIVEAEKTGRLRCTGNWSAGQTFGHLATWAEYPFDGYPKDINPPWIIKVLIKMQKKRFLEGPMPAGVKIPRVQNGTKGTQPMPTEAGHTRLRSALGRLKMTRPPLPNPLFGELSHEDWVRMNLRHAELHLSFLHPG